MIDHFFYKKVNQVTLEMIFIFLILGSPQFAKSQPRERAQVPSQEQTQPREQAQVPSQEQTQPRERAQVPSQEQTQPRERAQGHHQDQTQPPEQNSTQVHQHSLQVPQANTIGQDDLRKLDSTNCIAPFEYIPFAKPKWAKGDDVQYNNHGYYQRISPDGRFVIRSLSGAGMGAVSLLEMTTDEDGNPQAIAHKTPLSNEAFALLSTFRFVVDVDGRHYKIKDILKRGKAAKSHFRAGEVGVYAASTELAGGTEAKFKIRSIAWPNANVSDDSRGTGSLSMKESIIERDSKGIYKKTNEESFQLCKNLHREEGRIFTTPMISVNGEEVAARPIDPEDSKSSLRIYRIGQKGNCTKTADLGVEAEKVIFGYAKEGKPAPLLWSDISGLHFWDRELGENFYLQNPQKKFSSKGYPALLKDGRVMTAAAWDECKEVNGKKICHEVNGYVRIDPLQSPDFAKYRLNNPEINNSKAQCITVEEVQANHRVQSQIYGIEPNHVTQGDSLGEMSESDYKKDSEGRDRAR